ncbi:MAG: hypothetical protein ACRECY_13680 [Phyllobacterium sp.]
MLSIVELQRLPAKNPPTPDTVSEFITALVARDKNRYMPVSRIPDNPAQGGGPLSITIGKPFITAFAR